MKERRDLAEDGIIAVSVALAHDGSLLAPITVESLGFFAQDEDSDIFDEIRAASEKAAKEFAGGRGVDAEALGKGIKSCVREVIRRRNSSYAVVMPLISVAGGSRRAKNWLEKEFF